MGLAAISLPKKNLEEEIIFSSTEEGVRQALECSAGKVLLLSDDGSFSSFATFPRALSLIFDGDVLPLFSMPDGISRVLASGGEETLVAARYFAEVRGIPCRVFPSNAALFGVFERRGEVFLGDDRALSPLAECDAVCDMSRLEASLADAYARLLLARLALFEAKALTAFGIPREAEETALPETKEEIVLGNARLRRAESRGAYAGEGAALARLLQDEELPCRTAYHLLTSLYAAFFEYGKPRRYFTPDYRVRAAEAGTVPCVPTRDLALERMRAHFAKEIGRELKNRDRDCAMFRTPLRGDFERRMKILKQLPEYAKNGLSAIIRDFGLMEWV